MTTQGKKQLDKARPLLFKIAPLTASICWLYAFINLVVSYSLFFVYQPAVHLLIISRFLNLKVWGLVFLGLALAGIWSLLKNNWNQIRKTLLIGLVVKIAWEITLIIRTVQSPKTTILVTVMWSFFALVQAATYIYFLPEITDGRDNEQQPSN